MRAHGDAARMEPSRAQGTPTFVASAAPTPPSQARRSLQLRPHTRYSAQDPRPRCPSVASNAPAHSESSHERSWSEPVKCARRFSKDIFGLGADRSSRPPSSHIYAPDKKRQVPSHSAHGYLAGVRTHIRPRRWPRQSNPGSTAVLTNQSQCFGLNH